MKRLEKSAAAELSGSVTERGAKNAVLPIMAASVLAPCETELLNVQSLRDVDADHPHPPRPRLRVAREGDAVNIDSSGPLPARRYRTGSCGS